MAVASKIAFSASSNGRLIRLIDVASPGTLIHTTPTTNVKDVVHLWAHLVASATERVISIEFGGTATADLMGHMLTTGSEGPLGMVKIVDGFPLTTASGLTVRAFATSSDIVYVGGFVNRFT